MRLRKALRLPQMGKVVCIAVAQIPLKEQAGQEQRQGMAFKLLFAKYGTSS